MSALQDREMKRLSDLLAQGTLRNAGEIAGLLDCCQRPRLRAQAAGPQADCILLNPHCSESGDRLLFGFEGRYFGSQDNVGQLGRERALAAISGGSLKWVMLR